jgi:ACS family tartrate transporter-like MFS transporter
VPYSVPFRSDQTGAGPFSVRAVLLAAFGRGGVSPIDFASVYAVLSRNQVFTPTHRPLSSGAGGALDIQAVRWNSSGRAGGAAINEPYDTQIGAQALSKAFRRIVPLIALGYCFAFVDRVNISFAAQTMNRDLHFTATIYGLGGGLFFLSYALCGVPSNLLLVKFGARRWLAALMITWGLIAASMMFVRTPMQFYVVRFLLGAAEAGFFPGVIYYLSRWFPAEVRGRAISRFYVAWPLSNAAMGLVAGSLLGLEGRLGLAGWQWLLLVEGVPAALMGVVILSLLPEAPRAAKWLSPEEQGWIEHKLALELASAARHPDRGMLRALVNPIVLAFAFVNIVVLGSYYAFNLSAPQILGDATHLGVAGVGYVVAAGGLFGAASMLLFGWHSDYRSERFVHLAVPLLASAAAYGLLAMSSEPAVAIFAYGLAIASNAGIAATFWLVPSEVLAPRAMAVSVAAMNSVGQLGSFVSPFLWGVARDATGSYHLGITLLPLGYTVTALIVLGLGHQARARRVTGRGMADNVA